MDLIQIAKAAESNVVSCSGSDCTVCSILETIGNGYNFLTGLSFAVAVLFLALAGMIYIFGTGRKSFFLKAKNFARNAILGFVFVLVGWIAIHTVLYSTGYKNAGNWWQFQCETTASKQTVDLDKVNAYVNLADFISSGVEQGKIEKPISDIDFVNLIEKLEPGEKLTFYLPAKKNVTDQEETMIPFLAGYKDLSGNINLDELQAQILENLSNFTGGDSAEAFSLLGSTGNLLSSKQTNSLINSLFKGLFGVDPSNLSWAEKLEVAKNGIADFQKQNPVTSSSDSVSQAINDMINTALDQSEVLVKRSTTDSEKTSDKTSDKTSGDRSESKKDDTNNSDQAKKDELKKDPDYKELPSTQGENPVGPIDNVDKIKDKDQDDKKICDYSKATNAVEEALIRIECKDQLRYNMIHRFVKVIHNTTFPGGFCEACGEIAVNFNFPNELLDQLIIHEATHAGQFCLGLIDMNNVPKVEREACANQMGSLCREKHDENEGKGTDDFLMQEITCSGEKGKDGKGVLCRQKPHIEYRSSTAGTGNEEVRGYLSRWHVDANPSGDLKCEAYDWPVKYALGPHGPQQQRDTTKGPYHYGAHHCGEERILGLKKEENEDVKTIVKSQEQCKSKARPNLPKAMECEESGGAPIEIDKTPRQPGGM